jgi:3'-5' exonuclease
MSFYVIERLAYLLLVAATLSGSNTVLHTIGSNAFTMIRTTTNRRVVTDAIRRRSRRYTTQKQQLLNQRSIYAVPRYRHQLFLGSDYNVFSSSSLPDQQFLHENVLTTDISLDDVIVAAELQVPTRSATPVQSQPQPPPAAPPPPPLKIKATQARATAKPKAAASASKDRTARAAVASNSNSYLTSSDNFYFNDDDNIAYYQNDDDDNADNYLYSDRDDITLPRGDPNEPRSSQSPSNRAEYEAAMYPPKEVVRTVDDYNSIEDYLSREGIRSRPVPDGNWNVENPVAWAKDFGRRSPDYDNILRSIIKLQPGDEGYYDYNSEVVVVPETTVVRTVEQAKIVLQKLMNADQDIVHACDTEVMDIDLKSVGPVGNGYCTCVSIYSGPTFDYGLGHGLGTTLWIDNLDDACGLLQEFKAWFESETFKKVWHNYGFDRHILWNEGIDLRGFWGDTMHMARLEDTSRSKTAGMGGYGLEALTSDLLDERKRPMKELFGVKRKRKDGSEGSLVDIPPVEVLQRDPNYRYEWIKYSAMDAKSTWLLREELTKRLKSTSWIEPDTNMYDYYELHMRPFGEVLTDMERRGIRVDAKDYLATVEIQARQDRAHHVEVFRQWAAKQIGANGLAMNTASSTQLGTFLFGGARNQKTNEETERVREFKVPRDEIPEDALEAYRLEEEALKNQDKCTSGELTFAILSNVAEIHLTKHPRFRP